MNESDFNKRFGSNSPLPPYTWSDDDYASGWDITGDMPPTRQQFDALQRTNDDKAAYLLDKVYSSARLLRRSMHYNKGDRVYAEGLKAGLYLECATAGMSGTDAIDFSSSKVGDTITDGGVKWTVIKYALTTDVPPLASALATPRKIELTGNVTGSADFDGSKDIQIATSLADVSALAYSLLSKTTAADMRGVMDIKISGLSNGATPITAVIGDFAMAFGQSVIPGGNTELTVQLPFNIGKWGRKALLTQYGFGNYATLMYKDTLSSDTNIVVWSSTSSPDGIFFFWLVAGRKG